MAPHGQERPGAGAAAGRKQAQVADQVLREADPVPEAAVGGNFWVYFRMNLDWNFDFLVFTASGAKD